MVDPGSVNLLPIAHLEPFDTLSALLRAGRPRLGQVVSGPQGLAIQILGLKVPLPAGWGFAPGQTVEVTVVQTDNGPVLQVRPAEAPAADMAQPQPITASLISRVLAALGTLTAGQVASAGTVLPKGVPLSEAQVQTLVRLFTIQRSVGRPLAYVSALLAEAAEAGAVSLELARDTGVLADLMRASDAASFREALRSVQRRLGRPIEVAMARLLSTGHEAEALEVLSEHLIFRLMQLKADQKLTAFLKASGKYAAFREALDALLETVRAGQLQNLRGNELPYLFIELPLHPDTGFERAQVHFFGERGKGGGQDSQGPHVVAFDLRLSRLGDLWILVRTAGTHCACTFDAAAPEAFALIREQSQELAEALESSGFAQVSVDVRLWDGDRLAAAASVFESFSGLDLSA